MTTTALPDSDQHAVFTLLEDARRDEPGEVVPWALLEGLGQLIRADSVQLTELDWVNESLIQQQYLEQNEYGAITTVMKDEDTARYFWANRNFRACSDPQLSTPSWRATRFSDFYTDLELCNAEAYTEYYRLAPVRACLGVRLPGPPGRARRVLFMRSSFSHFTDRDVMLLTLLRPHLHEIYLDAERRRNGVPKLTPREWEILQLAGEGLPNAAIGQRLFISPATVRKHMEHIFDALGVRSRTEAAGIALPHRP
ncbi:MAG TPA: response regulator transcription factor [Mycobacterium sp.]|jgi:DNA-binding CsgD family transcriptional regulator|nr:response regulator transcription factor [Mycobacterium sp.]